MENGSRARRATAGDEERRAQRSTSGSHVAEARRGYEFVGLPPWLIVTYAMLPGNRLLANTVWKGAPDRGFRRARSLSPRSPSKKTRNSLPVVFAPRRFIHPSSTLHTYSLRSDGSIFRVWHGKFPPRYFRDSYRYRKRLFLTVCPILSIIWDICWWYRRASLIRSILITWATCRRSEILPFLENSPSTDIPLIKYRQFKIFSNYWIPPGYIRAHCK